MKILHGLGREQWTLAASVALGVLLTISSVRSGAGGGADARPMPSVDRAYSSPTSAAPELPQEKFGVYWDAGRDVFRGVAADKPPVPDLRPPTPRPEALVLPALRPGPAFGSMSRIKSATKFLTLVPGAPSVAEADLPAAAELAELKALVEPEARGREDRRAVRMHEFDVVYIKDGHPQEGRIIHDDEKGVQLALKNNSGRVTIPWSKIPLDEKTGEPKLVRGWTHEEEYKARLKKAKAQDAEAKVRLGEWCRESGMVAEAIAEFREAIGIWRGRKEFKRGFFEAVAAQGDLLQETGDHDGAVALYQGVGQATPFERTEMEARTGDVFRSLGLNEAALEAYRASLEASPRNTRARANMARVCFDLGRDAEAEAAVTELLTKYSDTVKPADRAEGFCVKGLLLLRQGNLNECVKALQEVLKVDPKHSEALTGLGVWHLLAGSAKNASAQFVAAIRANQYQVEAWMNLGILCAAAGKGADADGLFASALLRDPARAEAAAAQALPLLLAGKKPEAQAKLEAALKMDPGLAYAHYAIAQLQLEAGNVPEALAGFTEALRQEFHFTPAYAGAATAYLESARPLAADPKAADAARETVAKYRGHAEALLSSMRDFDPDSAAAQLSLGCVLAQQGRGREAEACLQKAMELRGKPDPLIAYARGFVQAHFGDGDAKSRLASARALFQQGAGGGDAKDPWTQACAGAVAAIEDWSATTVFLNDAFERADAPSVGAGWVEHERQHGITIALAGGRARFAGKQAAREMGVTRLERQEVPREDFLSFEVTLIPEAGKFEYGVQLDLTKQSDTRWSGLYVGIDLAGRLRFVHSDTQEFSGQRLDFGAAEVQNFTRPDPKEFRIKIERRREARGNSVLSVSVWDPVLAGWKEAVKTIPMAAGGSAATYRVGVWTRAAVGQEILLGVDDARILRKKTGP